MKDAFEKREELARLGEQITELAGHLNAGEYRFLALVEAFDREDGWQGEGIHSCAHWLETAEGEPLSVGRRTRNIPPAIRRALQRRDGGCCFPGCSATRFVDAHHVHHWADGGETRMDNLVLLCRRHHRLVHEGGFGLNVAPGGGFRFTDPNGMPLLNAPDTRSRGNVEAITSANAAHGLNITSGTAVPDWGGERMDHQLAVLELIQRE